MIEPAVAGYELEGAGGEVEAGGPHTEPPLEVEIVDTLLPQDDVVGLGLPREEVLGERRPVVGQVRLGTDRDDAAVEALAPQRLGRAQTREGRPDDGDGLQNCAFLLVRRQRRDVSSPQI